MTKLRFIKIFLSILLFLAFVLPGFQGLALTSQEERQALEKELEGLEEQIAQYENDITKTQQEKKTLQNQIYILKSKIEKLNLQIQSSTVMIRDVGFQIKDTGYSIEVTGGNIENSRQKLANILRLIYEEDQKSLFEALLLEDELSDFFENLAGLEALSIESAQLLQNIKKLKSQLEIQKEDLDDEKIDLERLLAIQVLQKKEGEQIKSDKSYLLDKTKGKEAIYQKYLQETQAKAAEIRKRIFELVGVPEAPTFGEALDLAYYVESVTGVRPALILAVLTQESNIGKNVGQCYLSNPKTGAGVRINDSDREIPRVMKPSRDVSPFLNITKALGRDPYGTPVSCPMSFGWGGAMGPAQFIPSTWNLYKDRAAEITGKTADPWDIRDAFLAAALYLSDYGAVNQTYNSEWKAVMIYFSGSTNPRYRFYGDSVMGLANKYQVDIETIEKSK